MICAVALAVAGSLALPVAVSAHAFLVRSSPADGQRLIQAPTAIQLEFTEAVAQAQLRLSRASAPTAVGPIGSPIRSGGGRLITFSLPNLPSGTYLATWEVISDDGHPSDGQLTFAVGGSGPVAAATTAARAPVDWGSSALRWIFLISLALAAGYVISRRWIWTTASTQGAWNLGPSPLWWTLVIASVAAFVQILLFLASYSRISAGSSTEAAVWLQAFATRPGLSALAAFLFAMAGLAFVRVADARVPQALMLIPISLSAVAATLVTHPANAGEWWAVAGIVVHVQLALLWLGLLAVVVGVLARHPEQRSWQLLMTGVGRYARIALLTGAAAIVTGLLPLLAELTHPVDLVRTGYGKIFLLKAALVGVALAAAGIMRLRTLARDPTPRSVGIIRRFTRAEATVLFLAAGVASLMSGIAPPHEFAQASGLAGTAAVAPPVQGDSLTLAAQTGWLEVYLTAGSGQLLLIAIGPGEETLNAASLQLSATTPDGRRQTLTPRLCGNGCWWVPLSWSSGTTEVMGRASSRNWAGGPFAFAVSWPPVPAAPDLLPRVIATMRAQPKLTLQERVASGPGSSAATTAHLSGNTFLEGEPYSAATADPHAVVNPVGPPDLILYLPGSRIWVRLALDPGLRVRTEVIVDPGHLIERTFAYP